MSTTHDIWESKPLSDSDARLVDLYRQTGVPLDSLPYTKEFEELVKLHVQDTTQENMRNVLQRLFMLRKQGRLPRVFRSA